MKKVVLTGGAGAGKTTLLTELGKCGFVTIPEAATIVIKSLVEQMGLEKYFEWRKKEIITFQKKIASQQLLLEQEIPKNMEGTVFLDRGFHDNLAYFRIKRISPPVDFCELASVFSYDKVFVLETLTNFKSRRETGRMSDYSESCMVGELLKEEYKKAGYNPIVLPPLSLAERLAIVMESTK